MVCFLRAHKKRVSTWGIRGGSERPQPAVSSRLVRRSAGLTRRRRGARCGAHAALPAPPPQQLSERDTAEGSRNPPQHRGLHTRVLSPLLPR